MERNQKHTHRITMPDGAFEAFVNSNEISVEKLTKRLFRTTKAEATTEDGIPIPLAAVDYVEKLSDDWVHPNYAK